MTETLEAGADVDAYCTRCKLVLAHVIVAMRGSRPVRVECKTCGSVHAFKSELPKKRTARRTAARDTTAMAQAEYETLMQGRDMSQALRYKIADEFSVEDVIDHKTFGIGLVTKVLSDNKIEVAFQGGPKILAHGRAN